MLIGFGPFPTFSSALYPTLPHPIPTPTSPVPLSGSSVGWGVVCVERVFDHVR